jgi:hypothetical protein
MSTLQNPSGSLITQQQIYRLTLELAGLLRYSMPVVSQSSGPVWYESLKSPDGLNLLIPR